MTHDDEPLPGSDLEEDPPVLAIENVQRLLGSPDGRIALHMTFSRAIASIQSVAREMANPAAPPEKEAFSAAVAALDTAVRPVATSLAWVVAWGQKGQHEQIVRSALRRLVNVADQQSGNETLIALRRWPAVLSLAAVGTAAVEFEREDMLGQMLSRLVVQRPGRDLPAAIGLTPGAAIEAGAAIQWLDRPQSHTAADDMVGERLADWLAPDLVHSATQVLYCFDRYQYLCGLVYYDEETTANRRGWAPAGSFKWRREYGWTVPDLIAAELEHMGADWPLLAGGLFGRDTGRAKAALEGYKEIVQGRF